MTNLEKRITLALNQNEANALLLAVETAMSKISHEADTEDSEFRLRQLDALWSRIVDAGIDKQFGRPSSQEASAYLDLMQCSEV